MVRGPLCQSFEGGGADTRRTARHEHCLQSAAGEELEHLRVAAAKDLRGLLVCQQTVRVRRGHGAASDVGSAEVWGWVRTLRFRRSQRA